MEEDKSQWRYVTLLWMLILSALLLSARIAYVYFADIERFPIKTIKVEATYQHISRESLKTLLAQSISESSFFTFPVKKSQKMLASLPWTKSISIERVWPDALKIKLIENTPTAIWNDDILMADGKMVKFNKDDALMNLPLLKGPENQQKEVLQVYEKIGKILSEHGFFIKLLEKRDNHSWTLTLSTGLQLFLGKQDIDLKIIRFCKAYPAVLQNTSDNAMSVDLRYPRGMAVKWNNRAG